MTAYLSSPQIWQESWDAQQEAFLPDREHRFATMLDAVAATTGGTPPRLLDLAGGTGTIALRTLARFPGAEVAVLDQDPVLLAIATASLRGRAAVVRADLADPEWTKLLPHRDYNAVLTATALHWLPAERVSSLYGEIRAVLRPDGIFCNADHMPDESMPALTKRLLASARARREARYAAGAALSWPDWWKRAANDEFLAPAGLRARADLPGEAPQRRVDAPARLARRDFDGGRICRGRRAVARRPGRRRDRRPVKAWGAKPRDVRPSTRGTSA